MIEANFFNCPICFAHKVRLGVNESQSADPFSLRPVERHARIKSQVKITGDEGIVRKPGIQADRRKAKTITPLTVPASRKARPNAGRLFAPELVVFGYRDDRTLPGRGQQKLTIRASTTFHRVDHVCRDLRI